MPAAAPASSADASAQDDAKSYGTRVRRPPPRYVSGDDSDGDAAACEVTDDDAAAASLLLDLGAPTPKRVKVEVRMGVTRGKRGGKAWRRGCGGGGEGHTDARGRRAAPCRASRRRPRGAPRRAAHTHTHTRSRCFSVPSTHATLERVIRRAGEGAIVARWGGERVDRPSTTTAHTHRPPQPPPQHPASTPPPSLHTLAPVFTCTACDGRVYLRGTRRPSFFCAACPSASRAQRRRQRALHGSVSVSVVEGAALLAAAGCGPQSPLPGGGGGGGGVCVATTPPPPRPVLHVAAAIAAAAAAARRTTSGPVPRPPLPPGPTLPKRAASDSTLGGSGAATTAVGGRCKCGKRISQDHPPCKSGSTLLFERLAARFGGAAGGECADAATAPPSSPPIMKLDDLAADCGVPRRRLYDILNVLEAVDVASRVGKLAYVWRGESNLPSLLDTLAADQISGAPVDESGRRGGGAAGRAARAAASDSSSGSGSGGGGAGGGGGGPAPQSLWALSKKFVRLLLTSEGPLALPVAAEALVGGVSARAACGPGELQQALVTAERRLYDVASILCCVGLIEKEVTGGSGGGRGGRAPAFGWAPAWRERAAAAVAAARAAAVGPPPPTSDRRSPPSSSGASNADDGRGRRPEKGAGMAAVDPPTPPACAAPPRAATSSDGAVPAPPQRMGEAATQVAACFG